MSGILDSAKTGALHLAHCLGFSSADVFDRLKVRAWGNRILLLTGRVSSFHRCVDDGSQKMKVGDIHDVAALESSARAESAYGPRSGVLSARNSQLIVLIASSRCAYVTGRKRSTMSAMSMVTPADLNEYKLDDADIDVVIKVSVLLLVVYAGGR